MSDFLKDKDIEFKEQTDMNHQTKRYKKIRKVKNIKQVYKNLFVSNYQGVMRLKKLKDRKIDVIINLESPEICKNHFNDKFEYQNFPIKDSSTQNISHIFTILTHLINNYLEQKKKVLIHCLKGISRAPSLVIAYLIQYKKFNYDKALTYIQTVYDKADPNFGIELQLRQMKNQEVSQKMFKQFNQKP